MKDFEASSTRKLRYYKFNHDSTHGSDRSSWSIFPRSNYIEHGDSTPVFGPRDDPWGGELPLLPFGFPIGFVPPSRGGVFIESTSPDE